MKALRDELEEILDYWQEVKLKMLMDIERIEVNHKLLQDQVIIMFLRGQTNKYRIWKIGDYYGIQKKFVFLWVWRDITDVWCNWYGKDQPKIFYSLKEIYDFINKKSGDSKTLWIY